MYKPVGNSKDHPNAMIIKETGRAVVNIASVNRMPSQYVVGPKIAEQSAAMRKY